MAWPCACCKETQWVMYSPVLCEECEKHYPQEVVQEVSRIEGYYGNIDIVCERKPCPTKGTGGSGRVDITEARCRSSMYPPRP
jgi:transcription elongation factor Elf1